MSNSPLVDFVRISPHRRSPRAYPISRITPHHMAGNMSVEGCGAEFAQPGKGASSNYGIGSDGRIGQYVDEADMAITSSNWDNDNRAVTIEVANDSGDPDWHVSDAALESLIALCVDICQRNGIEGLRYTGDTSGNLTMHKWFAPTLCPGPYLESKFPYIAQEVNRRLGIVEAAPELPGEPSTIVTVLEWQQAAIADGYELPQYGADGLWGQECEGVATRAILRNSLPYRNKNLTRLVQRAVGATVDGLYGPNTKTAVRAFQRKHGLAADGIVGINTWRAILGME